MKHKELLWMLLPCLLLLAAGVYFSRSKEVNGKFRVEISKAELVPATPRDVARGYDTVVLINAQMHAPPAVDLSYSSTKGQYSHLNYQLELVDSKGKYLLSIDSPGHLSANESPHLRKEWITYPFSLARIPTRQDALYLRVKAHGGVYSMERGKYLHQGQSEWSKLQVRVPNQQPVIPKVSKYQPFKVIGTQSTTVLGPAATNYELVFYVELFEPLQITPGRVVVAFDKPQIIADGKPIADGSGTSYSPPRNPMDIRKYLTIPPKCRNAKFKGELSINNCWPLPVEVELRRNGKDIQRPMPKLPTGLPPL